MLMKKILTCLVALFSLLGFSQTEQKKDLKVGLVLSGGGAKGLAHIGVLKAIEESGVRIDYIGGTSMGAIIGALYASGYSSGQLDSIFKEADFQKLIQDEVPRSAKTFYEKNNSEKYALTLPFDKFKISIPSAISKGQNVYNLYSKLLFHVKDVEDFDELPIPYFCVATDIETGQAIILNKGYLPEAIAASGALPSVFEPVQIGEKVLIDGGVINNYPIDEVRAKGADIIIGVDVQDDLSGRESLIAATDILLQISNYRTVMGMKEKSKKTDVYIKPNIKDFNVLSFDKGEAILKSGYYAGIEKKTMLDSIASLQLNKNRTVKTIQPYTKDTFRLSGYDIMGNERYTRAYFKGKLRFDTKEPMTFKKFNQGISNLAATNNFRGIHYYLKSNKEGNDVRMKMNVTETPTSLYLRLGLHYDELYKSAALVNITKKHLLFDDDVASFDMVLGDQIRYNFDYYLDKGLYWSFGLRSRYNAFIKAVDYDFVSDGVPAPNAGIKKIDVELDDITNQIYLQTVLREEFSFGMGLEHKYLTIETETIQGEDEKEVIFDNSHYYSAFGFLTLDTFDDKYFPTKGLFFEGDFHLYFGSSDYTNTFDEFSIAKAKMGFAVPIVHNVAFNFFTEGGFRIGEGDLNSLDFILGGYGNNLINNFVPFLGYDFMTFGGDSYVKAKAIVDWELFKKHHLNFSANIANAGNGIFENKEWITAPNYSGYGLGYSLETFIGPIEAKYTWSPELSKGIWFFNVGFWF